MNLSHEAITSFQKLYKDKCGIALDFEEAQVRALEDLKRFALIYRPIKIKVIDQLNILSSVKE